MESNRAVESQIEGIHVILKTVGNILPCVFAIMLAAFGGTVFRCSLPESERIIFVSEREDDPEIYMINRDGSGFTQLTDNMVEDTGPAASPDGLRFLYLSRLGEGDTFEIMTGRLDKTGTPVQLTSDFYDETHASWSPDGSHICFCRDVNGRLDLWVMDDRGEHQEPITTNPGSDMQPEWSPNSDRIAYIAQSPLDEQEPPQLFIINHDGTGKKQLTSTPTVKSDPCWSSDGSLIYFIEKFSDREEPYSLKSIDPESGTTKTVTTFRERAEHPYISRDGNTFIYSILGKGIQTEIYLFDLISGQEIRLTNNSFRDYSPRWIK